MNLRRLLHYLRNLIIWTLVVGLGWIALPASRFAEAALVLAVAYVVSLFLHPRVRCWDCDATGWHRGGLFRYSDRACTTCGGQSRHRRLGARVISPGSPLWAERARERAGQRRGRPL
jgi:hypothetical protein